MDKNKYCPVVKEVCKGVVCMAWKGSDCSILAFFMRFDNPEIRMISSPETHPGCGSVS